MNSPLPVRVKPLLITAPSGCGKGTLITRLLSDYPNIFKQNVSYTTRQPRNGEVHGTHRFFVSLDEFKKAIAENKFIEHAIYADNYYGTNREFINSVIDSNKICLIEVEVQGAKSIAKSDFECNSVFILPPSLEVLRTRLIGRGSETEDKITKRLEAAKWELEESQNSDLFPVKITNDDFNVFYETFKEFLKKYYPNFNF